MHVLLPAIEVGIPTVCSETCVGRLRYIGLVLYDADKVLEGASVEDDQALYAAQRSCFPDPDDPAVQRAAEEAGIPGDWVEAAQRSPVWALINRYEVALPLHPEYRTMPMVWYIPRCRPSSTSSRRPATTRRTLVAQLLFALWPFTRLVHVFSAPVGYLTRPYIVYRSRHERPGHGTGSRAPQRGWDTPTLTKKK